jgi:DNA-nicking Smr family endonuclease
MASTVQRRNTRAAASPATPAAARRTAAGLADLKRLRDEALRQRQQLEAAEAQAREARLKAERERRLFELSVGPVLPVKSRERRERLLDKPEPVARQRALDEAQALREAWSDGLDAQTLLDTDDQLGWCRSGVGPDVVQRLRRGVWAIQAHCDLHGLRRDDARERLASFLRDALRAGLRCVRVVHGKGNGSPGRAPVLKGKVRHWLMQKNEVLAYTQARAADGGHGALLVLLQPGRGSASQTGATAPGNTQPTQAPARLRIQSAVPKKA